MEALLYRHDGMDLQSLRRLWTKVLHKSVATLRRPSVAALVRQAPTGSNHFDGLPHKRIFRWARDLERLEKGRSRRYAEPIASVDKRHDGNTCACGPH